MNENKLNFLHKEDIIEKVFLQQQYELTMRNKYLNMHPWSISQGKDGFWRTYLPNEEKKRKMVKKSFSQRIRKCCYHILQKKGRKKQNSYFL